MSRRDIGEDGRPHVVAASRPWAAGPPVTSRAPSVIARRRCSRARGRAARRHERAEVAWSGRTGRRRRDASRHRRGDLLGLGEPRARHEHPGQRAAGLARVEEALRDAVGDRLLEVGVVEDDVGRLAAELERDGLDGPRRQLATRRPARVEPVKVTMSTSGCAAIASPTTGPGARDEVEDAGRQAGGLDDLGQHEGVQRGDLARLDHDGAADRQGRRDLRRDLVQRVVPRRDAADDADRLAQDERVAELGAPRRPPRRAPARGGRSRAAVRPGSAGPAGTGMPSSVAMSTVSSSARASSPSAMRVSAAWRTSSGACDHGREGGARGRDRAVDVGRRPERDAPGDLLRGGVDDVERRGRRTAHPGAVDVEVLADMQGVRTLMAVAPGQAWAAAVARAGAGLGRDVVAVRCASAMTEIIGFVPDGGRERAGRRRSTRRGCRAARRRVGDRVAGSAPIRALPIWCAVKSRTPPARSGSRREARDEAPRGRRRGATSGRRRQDRGVAAPAASWRRTSASKARCIVATSTGSVSA